MGKEEDLHFLLPSWYIQQVGLSEDSLGADDSFPDLYSGFGEGRQ